MPTRRARLDSRALPSTTKHQIIRSGERKARFVTGVARARDPPVRRMWHADAISSRELGEDAREPMTSNADTTEAEEAPDYDRDLGVIEAITFVTRSCPSGVVVSVAEQALEAIKQKGAEAIPQQAYFVLTSMQGWRGDRARQVHRSLTKFLEERERSS
ncbi:MAG: hypothetical protein CL931_03970 [Deltaproteobacteria bacterium]|nr:hypothetical protein [Deltaproteobacteria bacterium]